MNINTNIAKTYIFAGKKQTAVAGIGVLLGMAIYIFMNCLMLALDRSSTSVIFKNNAHLRVYKEDKRKSVLGHCGYGLYHHVHRKTGNGH